MKFIQAAENNKTEILRFFEKLAKLGDIVLEIGSGTGQHIVFFAGKMKHVFWQPSEKPGNTISVEQRVISANLANLRRTTRVFHACSSCRLATTTSPAGHRRGGTSGLKS